MSTSSYVMSAEQIDDLEGAVQRLTGFVVRAARVADRSEQLPCLDRWGTRERLARLDDAVFAGQRLLARLCNDW